MPASRRTASTYLVLLLPHVFAGPVSIKVDVSSVISNFTPFNTFFGFDEPNYAYLSYGEQLLGELGALGPTQTYFRTHNLLTTGNGTPNLKWGSTNAYTEDSNGSPIYNWTIIDRISETYLKNNVKPYLQVGFMPKALATSPEPYNFTFQAVSATEKKKVDSWYWEIWNEPNIPYWNGTTEQFYMLHDYAITSIRRTIPKARVGGPEVAGGPGNDDYLGRFINHTLYGKNALTGEVGTPLDFLSSHAKGQPVWINATEGNPAHLRLGIYAQLKNIDDALGVIASFPEVRDKPIVIGEMDPDGCAACVSPQYGYRNGIMFPSYTAASFARALDLSLKHGVNLRGTLTWAFEYDGHEYFDGFRVLATNGIDKPVLNVHRILAQMVGKRVAARSSGQVPLEDAVKKSINGTQTDVGVLSTYDEQTKKLFIFVWHYHDDDLPKPDADVQLDISRLTGCGERMVLKHYRIDDDHSNAYTKWLRMASPQNLTSAEYAELKAAGQLQMLGKEDKVDIREGKTDVTFTLPIHGTSLLVLEG
ncbi:xylan 1,4-beta-xylosidase [Clohesyomyces aquaticus]|uniref:Xylan 1,4-beta-xylosidase n=1 Tax=Clohesyomyces aquaticus TaxID=1231657 RepID=A0A1Y1XWE8_9PLEO|nr:xylan 1,4-beta-xylosidase [Clohesyomyces aquaticus]